MFQSTRPRGARQAASRRNGDAKRCFNPRAHVGRDSTLSSDDARRTTFQSTRPRGARRNKSFELIKEMSFNPRAHVGRDIERKKGQLLFSVSIHAPTWGATPSVGHPFQIGLCFNPRAHVGRDLRTSVLVYDSLFQSTRPRGARLGEPQNRFVGRYVSIHAPTWGAT